MQKWTYYTSRTCHVQDLCFYTQQTVPKDFKITAYRAPRSYKNEGISQELWRVARYWLTSRTCQGIYGMSTDTKDAQTSIIIPMGMAVHVLETALYWFCRTSFKYDVPSGRRCPLQIGRSFLHENYYSSTDSRQKMPILFAWTGLLE